MRATRALAAFLLFACMLVRPAFADDTWNVDRLAAALAEAPRKRIAFEELRYVPALEDPVMLSGYLLRPNAVRLEKHVQAPVAEQFIIDGDTVTVSDSTGEVVRFDIARQPALHAIARAFRGLLGGQLAEVKEAFEVELSGTAEAWELRLAPRDPEVRAGLSLLRLDGRGGVIRRIETLEADGGRSVLTLLPTP